ncbi:E3 ubiquitin-protein ligase TRIM21-like [Macrotis lagotis]|uniref:E3 ubiquitin-protein ligase TRIM21-like n=1 Tax=Macrotis lagotis TaxID=92651 RepID=UPI003D69AE49
MEMLQKLQKELTCGICRSYFSQPVTIGCGHSFCQACLSFCWRAGVSVSCCPECRQVSRGGEFPAINEQLAQLTELGKEFCFQLLQRTKEGNHCATHNQVFKLFCEDDQALLCGRCCQTQEHGAHKISPIEEAAHNCREKLQNIQSHLRRGLEDAEKLLVQKRPVDTWQWMISIEFCKLQGLLMSEENKCLQRVREEQQATQERLFQRQENLQDLKGKLQRSGHQPNLELLQNAKQLLTVLSQRPIPEMREYAIPGMIEMLRTFRVDITLDPISACPSLSVSEDLKSVKAGEGWQVDTKHVEVSACHYVFAEQTFSSDKYYWEVDVTQLPQWVLGIHNSHLRTRSDFYASVFLLRCVKKKEDFYLESYPRALNHRVKGPVPRIGVYLDFQAGILAFYNVLQNSLIYKFQYISLVENITPIFSPGPPLPETKDGSMILCPAHLCTCCHLSC